MFWTVKARELDPWFPNKLEADIFPHLVVVQNFTDFVSLDNQRKRGLQDLQEFSYSISGTPAVRIRMLRDVSAPVRTPSYMPRVNVQVLWARNFKGEVNARADSASTKDLSDVVRALRRLPSVSLWEAHLIVGHHSNGQDGCITTQQERVPARTGECVPAVVGESSPSFLPSLVKVHDLQRSRLSNLCSLVPSAWCCKPPPRAATP